MKLQKIIQCFILLALAMASTSINANNVVIIVNAGNTSSFSADDIKRIMLARTNRHPDGTAAQVILRSSAYTDWQICTNKFLGKTPDEVQRAWASRVFSGAVSAPVVLAGDPETVQAVSSQRGAIACVNAASVAGNKAVRIISE